MRLIKCYIENFGLLHTTEFNFSKGLNCCLSENGTGKTTLTAFIEAMLYGIGDTRRQALDENPRKKYNPWQGGRFGGSLTLEVGKKKYTIERSFGQKAADDTFRLIETDSGKISYEYGEDIGEKLFGIDRDGFLRTVFLSEKNISGKNENKSISAKLSDLVGVDGDVGGFDDAIKLLEDRRKFYQKKGNTGEIANVKERINEVQRRIDAINGLEESAEKKEERLKELRAERARLSELEEIEKAKLGGLQKIIARSAYEERYAAMVSELNTERERLKEVSDYFKNGIPSALQIDRIRDAHRESERLREEALNEVGNEEYAALGEFFKNGTDFVEIAEMENAAKQADDRLGTVKAIDNGFDRRQIEMRTIFPDTPPKRDEIDGARRSKKAKFSPLKTVLILIGLVLAVGGVILGEIYGYAIAAVGAVLAIISASLSLKPKKSKEELAFLQKFGICDCQSSDDALNELSEKLDRYEALEAEVRIAREVANEQYTEFSIKVCDFLARFPMTGAETPLAAVATIRNKYNQYYKLSQAYENAAGGKLDKIKRSEDLAKEVKEFLSYFPIATNEPFTELRDRLNEYNYLKQSVAKLQNDTDRYSVEHNVTGKVSTVDMNEEASISKTIQEIADRQKALSAEYALVEREVNLERAEIEKKDEYIMAKEELEELYKKHIESLEIIKKTAQYLSAACDNITSKYLGKTKAKFEEYSSLIAGIEGEYSLNTSFELSRTERGESHTIEAYSRGTRDLYALGLRLALVDALYEKESPFIILDDPFIALDDVKLERAKATLKSLGKSKQILYFTCSKAREIV